VAAQALAEKTDLPVISCGSGPHCDGQVLVLHEILSLPGATGPRFSKRYADIGEQIRAAAGKYVEDIRQKRFPDEDHSYHMSEEHREEFQRKLVEKSQEL